MRLLVKTKSVRVSVYMTRCVHLCISHSVPPLAE